MPRLLFQPFSLFQAQACLQESAQKIDLLRLSLERVLGELSPDHPKRALIKQELVNTFCLGAQHSGGQPFTSLIKPTALTGTALILGDLGFLCGNRVLIILPCLQLFWLKQESLE